MKLAFITSESFIDHSYTIVTALQKSINIRTYLQGKRKNEEINLWCNKLDAEFVKRRRFRNPLSFFFEFVFLYRLKDTGFDGIWFNTMTFYQIVWAKLLLKNFLVTVHDVDWHPKSRDYFGVISKKINLLLIRKHICVVSKTQSNIFKSKYGFEPILMQLPIIDYYSSFNNEPSHKSNETGVFKFFYFGTIEKYKGIETLISAAEILDKENIKFELNIYGKQKYKLEEILYQIKKIKSINLFNVFVDFTEVHSIYCKNHILILPYRQVTQCGPLLIAYNENTPVICSYLPGFREYVEDNKSGLIFNNTPQDLANKMLFLINNPQFVTQMREYIMTEIHHRYSIEYLIDSYISNLEKSMNK